MEGTSSDSMEDVRVIGLFAPSCSRWCSRGFRSGRLLQLKHLPDLESTLLNHGRWLSRPFQLLLSGCHLASACHKYSLTYMYVFRAFQHIKHNPSSDATRTCPLCQSLSRLLMTAALSSCVQRPLSNRSEEKLDPYASSRAHHVLIILCAQNVLS